MCVSVCVLGKGARCSPTRAQIALPSFQSAKLEGEEKRKKRHKRNEINGTKESKRDNEQSGRGRTGGEVVHSLVVKLCTHWW